MNCNDCLFEDDAAVYEMMARLEAVRICHEERRRHRLSLGLRKVMAVLVVSLLVFLVPGLVLCAITGRGGLGNVAALSVVATLFCHPLQLLAIDWACNWSGCRKGHRT